MTSPIDSLLFPKQVTSCREASARLNIWEGSVSSGKTYCSIWKWLSWLVNEAPKRGSFLMSGKTERTLQRNIIDPIQEMIGDTRFHLNRASGVINYYGRTIYIAGANDERAENKIRGLTLAGAYGDELTLWPESYFNMLLSRLRVKGARFYGTTNPDSPYHWLKTGFLDRESELNLKRFKFLLPDNTTLDPEYVKSIEVEYQGLWYKRFILGEWCQAEGAIYDMFDEKRHVKTEAEFISEHPHLEKQGECVGVDYGTSNPTAAIYLRSYTGGTIYAPDGYYYDGRANQRQKTDSEFVAAFEQLYVRNGLSKSVPLIVDPSAASLKTEARKHGFSVRDADNSVLDGIRVVSRLFGEDKLFISPKCENLSKELLSYVWDATAQKHGIDAPKKENDHGCDAMRYGVMALQRGNATQSGFSQYSSGLNF